jgi:uncharacterized radical SAM superfamily protein
MSHHHTVRHVTEALLDASRETGLEVCVEKIKYVYVHVSSSNCTTCNTKVPNKTFENVAKLKYFVMMARVQICIHVKIKDRVKSRECL